jgi:hypothetical protein
MIGCLVMGDSIAVGVGQQLPECRTEARVGISSTAVVQALRGDRAAEKVVISLGANDGASGQTLGNLQDLRRTVSARVVYWLLPASSAQARSAIHAVAARYGDRVIDTAPYAGPDRLHPTGTGYRALAALTRAPV